MNIKSKVERLERGVPPRAAGEECEACAALRRGIARVYGEPVEPFGSCAPAKCDGPRRNLMKVYGGDNGDGLKAAA